MRAACRMGDPDLLTLSASEVGCTDDRSRLRSLMADHRLRLVYRSAPGRPSGGPRSRADPARAARTDADGPKPVLLGARSGRGRRLRGERHHPIRRSSPSARSPHRAGTRRLPGQFGGGRAPAVRAGHVGGVGGIEGDRDVVAKVAAHAGGGLHAMLVWTPARTNWVMPFALNQASRSGVQ